MAPRGKGARSQHPVVQMQIQFSIFEEKIKRQQISTNAKFCQFLVIRFMYRTGMFLLFII